MKATFSVSHVSAWAPNIDTDELWREWARLPYQPELLNEKLKPIAPALKTVPAMQRRRFSFNTRIAIQCALETQALSACQGDLPNVFASPQGELHKTLALLDSVDRREPLSPMGFSLSVHNTAAGLYSIHANNRAQSSSVAAQRNTLLAGFIEALCLSVSENQPVLLVFSEEPLPERWQGFQDYDVFAHGFACLVSHANLPVLEGGVSVELSTVVGDIALAPPGLAFLQWYFGDNSQNCLMAGECQIINLCLTDGQYD